MSRPKQDIGVRPICDICNSRPRQLKRKNKKGEPKFEPFCYNCKGAHYAKKQGISREAWVKKLAETTAYNNGHNTPSEHKEHLAAIAKKEGRGYRGKMIGGKYYAQV